MSRIRDIDSVRYDALMGLFNKPEIWSEDLLCESVFKLPLHYLEPREFFVLEEKVNGTSRMEMARILKVSLKRVINIESQVKTKLKDYFYDRRVDDIRGIERKRKPTKELKS